MHLRSKLTSKIFQKVGNLDGKAKQNRLKVPLCHLFLKKLLDLLKNDKYLSIFFYRKSKCTYKFYVFTVKRAFGNVAIRNEFRFENSLK